MPVLRLLPNQIAKHWDTIKAGIAQALPPMVAYKPGVMGRILRALLAGELQCWVLYEKRDGRNLSIVGVATTQICADPCSGTKNLLIYSLYGHRRFSGDLWKDIIEAASNFARANGCQKMVAYTAHPVVLQAVKRAGWDTQYTYVTYDLE